MPVPESQLVQWMIESNAEGQWALFVRVAGVGTQLTEWCPTREAVIAALRRVVVGE